MPKCCRALLPLFLLGVLTASLGYAKDAETSRMLNGKVVNQAGQPISDAVVYLTNSQTKAIKTYIVGPSGAFSFPGLSLNVDYEVFAQFHGHKSDTKTISQFDNRTRVTLNLRIDMK